jgi:hypothetical protein
MCWTSTVKFGMNHCLLDQKKNIYILWPCSDRSNRMTDTKIIRSLCIKIMLVLAIYATNVIVQPDSVNGVSKNSFFFKIEFIYRL